MTVPALGNKLANLAFPVSEQETLTLEQFKGRPVVLFFYPKDNTPGCTRENQNFRDISPLLKAQDTVVLGISRDSFQSHEKFCEKHQLPFPLVSDRDDSLSRYFGVLKQKKILGKGFSYLQRSTFLIDREGRLIGQWRQVAVKNHAKAVLTALQQYTHTDT